MAKAVSTYSVPGNILNAVHKLTDGILTKPHEVGSVLFLFYKGQRGYSLASKHTANEQQGCN